MGESTTQVRSVAPHKHAHVCAHQHTNTCTLITFDPGSDVCRVGGAAGDLLRDVEMLLSVVSDLLGSSMPWQNSVTSTTQ